ncbi:MAG: DUF1003 domain-containing protein [Theionarchaea archaeon]|nr:DUF1003 domain-containing protein [Theionarchaea archaeon]MBU7037987.1 DUF1003 domain-containing protein [Theionarchaea archaeon]
MTDADKKTIVCGICGEHKDPDEVIPGDLIRDPLVETIQKKYPQWSPSGFICLSDLNHFRSEYVREILETEKGELSSLEEQVMKSLREQELISRDINVEFQQNLTFGERLSDALAKFAGSWLFIMMFFSILVVWIGINSVVLLSKHFDPYPFILLNLVLSCLAAIQAPVIMMSQNRQESKDRLRSEHDYVVNLKAEVEIRNLHEKIDHLLANQWQRLLQIQEIQMELMEELARRR